MGKKQKDELDIVVSNLMENTHIGRWRDREMVNRALAALEEIKSPDLELCTRVLNELLEDRLFLHWTFGKLKEATVSDGSEKNHFKLEVSWNGEPSLYRIFRFMHSNEPPPQGGINDL